MEKKLKLLSKMVKVDKNPLGDESYTPFVCTFMEFQEFMEMNKEDYIEFIKKMRSEKYLQIDMAGRSDIIESIISVTKFGVEYLAQNKNKKQIGFN